mgnify:CR=1 FL=1
MMAGIRKPQPITDHVPTIGGQTPPVKVIEVPGYGGPAKGTAREPLEVFVHGLAGSGKTSLIATLPASFALLISEPGATLPILSKHGLDRVPRIITRNWDEFTTGIEGVHKGARVFLEALPQAIRWVAIDTFSSLLTTQHAAHLASAEDDLVKKVALAKAKGKAEPGLDKFRVMDQDLNRGRLVQLTLQKSGRNLLYLAHTSPMSDDTAANERSNTAGRPVIPGQLRTYLEAWASAILYIQAGYETIRDGDRARKVYSPTISLEKGQQPLVKHKWDLDGKYPPHLGDLLKAVGEWPR